MANPYVIGLDAVLKYKKGEIVDAAAPALDGAKVIDCTNVSYSDSLSLTDVTTRAAGGFRQQAATLRELEVTTSLIVNPDSQDYLDLYEAYANRERIALFVGDDRGNYFAMIVIISSWSITQDLESAETAELTFTLSKGGWTPQWLNEE